MKKFVKSEFSIYVINERYIPEHQNKLNVYDLQNYEFLRIFFNRKKIRKIR